MDGSKTPPELNLWLRPWFTTSLSCSSLCTVSLQQI